MKTTKVLLARFLQIESKENYLVRISNQRTLEEKSGEYSSGHFKQIGKMVTRYLVRFHLCSLRFDDSTALRFSKLARKFTCGPGCSIFPAISGRYWEPFYSNETELELQANVVRYYHQHLDSFKRNF